MKRSIFGILKTRYEFGVRRRCLVLPFVFLAGGIGFAEGTGRSPAEAAARPFAQAVKRLAQAGGESGIRALNRNNWEGWKINGPEAVKEMGPVDMNGAGAGYVKVKIENRESHPDIVSEAVLELDLGLRIRREVEYRLKPQPLFSNAVTAGDYVYFYRGKGKTGRENTVEIDSYNSAKGAYDVNRNRNDEGNVAGGLIYSYRTSVAEIYGNAATQRGERRGEFLSLGEKGRIYGQETGPLVQIDASRISEGFHSDFPDISPPLAGKSHALPEGKKIKLGNSLRPEQYHVAGDLIVEKDQTLRIVGPVTLIIDDDFIVRGRVEIKKPLGKLVVYLHDDFKSSPKGIMNYTEDPQKLIIYSTAERNFQAYFYFLGNSDLYASIYAPRAFIGFYSDGKKGAMHGAAVGNRIVFRGNYAFHFDEKLKSYYGETPHYAIEEERVLSSSEIVAMVP